MNASRLMRWCCGASLVSLPWIGLGVVAVATGRDLGAGLQPSWLALGVATAAAAVTGSWRRGALPPTVLRFAVAAGGALVLSLAGLRLAPSGEPLAGTLLRFGKQTVQLGVMAAFLVWPAVALRGEARWRWAIRLLVAGALLQVAYGALQWLHWYRPGPLLPLLDRIFTSNPAILSGSEQLHLADGFRDVPRLRGTAAEPLYLGNYLLLALPLLGLTGWKPRVRAAAGGLLGLLLLLTWSRGAWLAGAGGAVLWAGLVAAGAGLRRPGPVALRYAAFVAAAALLASVLLGPDRLALPWERLVQSFSSRDWSNLTRIYSMQAAWRAFLLSPVVGVGWGQFAWHFPLLVDAAGLQSQFQWPVVNNFPLQILCETGVVGFAVFAAAAVALGLAGWRQGRGAGLRAQRVRLCLVATAAVWLQLLTFSQYNLPHIWLAPGLLLAALADRDGGEA